MFDPWCSQNPSLEPNFPENRPSEYLALFWIDLSPDCTFSTHQICPDICSADYGHRMLQSVTSVDFSTNDNHKCSKGRGMIS